MKKQRGQAVVEFALVLPLFLVFLFGVILSGMLFADYMTLSNVARGSAREASLQGESSYDTIRNNYRASTHLLTSMYTWPAGQAGMEFNKDKYESLNNSITVTIRMNLNPSFPGVSFMKSISNFPPDTYTIDYTMHNENADTGTES